MKTIIFDFDGTLTERNQNIWKMIWQTLGYSTDKDSDYAKLYMDCIINKKITRKQWFDYTCDFYMKKNMSKEIFDKVNEKIHIINGCQQTLVELNKMGYHLIILSGCIVETIKKVLGENCKFFDIIESNKAIFDDSGKLIKLEPTPYDYEGKSTFISKYMSCTNSKPEDIIFVGNSDNDEFVYRTGIKTICINPTKLADIYDNKKWNQIIYNLTDLRQLLPSLKNINKKDNNELILF